MDVLCYKWCCKSFELRVFIRNVVKMAASELIVIAREIICVEHSSEIVFVLGLVSFVSHCQQICAFRK